MSLLRRARLARFPIATRLTLWFGLSMLLLLGTFGVFLYSTVHLGMHSDAEHLLLHEEEALRRAVVVHDDGARLDPAQVPGTVALGLEGGNGTYARLFDAAGNALYQSPNFPPQPLAIELPSRGERTHVVHNWQGTQARSLYSPVRATDGAVVAWLEITRLETAVHRSLHRLDWLLVLGGLLGTLAAVGSGRWIAQRALRPIAALTREANELRPDNLDRRLTVPTGVRDEVTELAETLDELLGRVDASLERERRFRADAAHEMFTPLSAIRSEIDVTLRRARTPDEYRRTIEAVRAHSHRLSLLVDGLLKLSRAEALEVPEPGAADVSSAARGAVERFVAVAAEKEVELSADVAPDLFARIAESDLTTVIENLLDNAIKYTPAGGRVTVVASKTRDRIALLVRDTGAGFDPSEAPHLFARFYRADDAAVQRSRGCGLGLAIVRATLSAYGGDVTARSAGRGKGSTFEVWLARCAGTTVAR
ncbi:MAG: ATP-binding protein [Thermoanaerobaculia bacterium]|nr:ATP-binding protein [Thermoanaerobaculia bacterium]